MHINPMLLSIDGDQVTASYYRNRPAHRCLRTHVPYDEAMAGAAVPPVGDERHVGEFRAHDRSRRFQLLRHSGPSLGSFVPDDDHHVLAVRDLAPVHSGIKLVLLVEDQRLAREAQPLLSCDLCHCACGRKVPAQDLDVACGLDRVAERADEDLVLWE